MALTIRSMTRAFSFGARSSEAKSYLSSGSDFVPDVTVGAPHAERTRKSLHRIDECSHLDVLGEDLKVFDLGWPLRASGRDGECEHDTGEWNSHATSGVAGMMRPAGGHPVPRGRRSASGNGKNVARLPRRSPNVST